MVVSTFFALKVSFHLAILPAEKAKVQVAGQGWLAERRPPPGSSHERGSQMQRLPSLPLSATTATSPSSPATAFTPPRSPSLHRGGFFPSLHVPHQGTPARTQQRLIRRLRGVPHERPRATDCRVRARQPVQRPRADPQRAAARHHVPPGEALAEEAEVTAGGAAVLCCSQPAAAYQGKQGDQCWDHWGDRSHRTFLNT